MLLYLMRHGEAEGRAARDEDRELTSQGLAQTQLLAARFKAYSPALGAVLVSPYVRAQQSAASMQALFSELQFETTRALTPEADVYALIDEVENLDLQHIMLVGHNPLLSTLLSILVDGTSRPPMLMSTGTLVCVELDILAPGCGELKYTLEV